MIPLITEQPKELLQREKWRLGPGAAIAPIPLFGHSRPKADLLCQNGLVRNRGRSEIAPQIKGLVGVGQFRPLSKPGFEVVQLAA
jgi:hypothetical protein